MIGTCSGTLASSHSWNSCRNCRFVVCPSCRATLEDQTALDVHNCSSRRRFNMASPLRGRCMCYLFKRSCTHRFSRPVQHPLQNYFWIDYECAPSNFYHLQQSQQSHYHFPSLAYLYDFPGIHCILTHCIALFKHFRHLTLLHKFVLLIIQLPNLSFISLYNSLPSRMLNPIDRVSRSIRRLWLAAWHESDIFAYQKPPNHDYNNSNSESFGATNVLSTTNGNYSEDSSSSYSTGLFIESSLHNREQK